MALRRHPHALVQVKHDPFETNAVLCDFIDSMLQRAVGGDTLSTEFDAVCAADGRCARRRTTPARAFHCSRRCLAWRRWLLRFVFALSLYSLSHTYAILANTFVDTVACLRQLAHVDAAAVVRH